MIYLLNQYLWSTYCVQGYVPRSVLPPPRIPKLMGKSHGRQQGRIYVCGTGAVQIRGDSSRIELVERIYRFGKIASDSFPAIHNYPHRPEHNFLADGDGVDRGRN